MDRVCVNDWSERLLEYEIIQNHKSVVWNVTLRLLYCERRLHAVPLYEIECALRAKEGIS